MKFIDSFLGKFKKGPSGVLPRKTFFTRDRIIVWSAAVLFIAFLASVGFDAYLFYYTIIDPPHVEIPIENVQKNLSAGDIDEVIRLLDERKIRFDSVLGNTSAGSPNADSLP